MDFVQILKIERGDDTMPLFFKRKLSIFVLTFSLLILAEMTVFLIIFQTLYANFFLLEMGIYVLLLSPILLFKNNKIAIGYSATILSLVLLLFAINVTLDYASRDIFTFAYLKQAGEAFSIFDWDYINWLALTVFFGFSGLYVLGVRFIYKVLFKGNEEVSHFRYLPKGVLLFLALSITALSTEAISENVVYQEYASNPLFENMSGYQIINYLSNYLKKTSMKKYGIISYSLATAQSSVSTTQIESLPSVDEETINITPLTDDYYGLLDGYNVIEIMIESGSEYLLNEELTPNLWNLQKEGIYFTNNYSKNKTNVSEFIGINGATLQNIQYYEGELPYSIPQLIKEKGYTSSYFHNNYGEFYNRNKEMQTLGFDNIYFSLDINEERQWHNNYDGNYPLDSETIDDIMDRIAPANSTPYYSYWTTLSMHGPYTGTDNWNKFIELGYVDKLHQAIDNGLWENPCLDDPIEVQAQIEMVVCETMDFDFALGKLIRHLKDTNQYDHTLLVLYGDHETYYSVGIDRPLKEYVYNCLDEKYPKQFETMLFISNPTLTKKYKEHNSISIMDYAYYNDFTSPYIIVPTIFELLGIKYNPDYYTGVSIFQTETPLDNIFYSNELGSLFTDKIYTIDVSGEYLYQEEDLPDSYLELFQEKITKLLEKINSIDKMYMNGEYKKEEEART